MRPGTELAVLKALVPDIAFEVVAPTESFWSICTKSELASFAVVMIDPGVLRLKVMWQTTSTSRYSRMAWKPGTRGEAWARRQRCSLRCGGLGGARSRANRPAAALVPSTSHGAARIMIELRNKHTLTGKLCCFQIVLCAQLG